LRPQILEADSASAKFRSFILELSMGRHVQQPPTPFIFESRTEHQRILRPLNLGTTATSPINQRRTPTPAPSFPAAACSAVFLVTFRTFVKVISLVVEAVRIVEQFSHDTGPASILLCEDHAPGRERAHRAPLLCRQHSSHHHLQWELIERAIHHHHVLAWDGRVDLACFHNLAQRTHSVVEFDEILIRRQVVPPHSPHVPRIQAVDHYARAQHLLLSARQHGHASIAQGSSISSVPLAEDSVRPTQAARLLELEVMVLVVLVLVFRVLVLAAFARMAGTVEDVVWDREHQEGALHV
jgi:hypothetical protein